MTWLAIEFELDAPQARPGARIALCGILECQAAEVAAVRAPDFGLGVERIEGGWALLAGLRR